jgi:hypothetical protein
MKYVRREPFEDDLIGDADGLMREFYRAQESAHDLDQHMISDTVVNPGHLVLPSASVRGATLTHDAANALLAVTGDAVTDLAANEAQWTSNDTALEFTSYESGWFRIVSNADYVGGTSGSFVKIDARVLVDGRPGATITQESVYYAGGFPRVGLVVDDMFNLLPGDHVAYVQYRERSATLGTVSGVDLYAMGLFR